MGHKRPTDVPPNVVSVSNAAGTGPFVPNWSRGFPTPRCCVRATNPSTHRMHVPHGVLAAYTAPASRATTQHARDKPWPKSEYTTRRTSCAQGQPRNCGARRRSSPAQQSHESRLQPPTFKLAAPPQSSPAPAASASRAGLGTNVGNMTLPVATFLGHRTTCFPFCHCMTTPGI